jgi:hypothetical protein
MNIDTKNFNFWALLGVTYSRHVVDRDNGGYDFRYPSKTTVLRTINTLPKRIATVIKLRFGLDGTKPMTLSETGRVIGVQKERVRQIESKGLRMLAHPTRKKAIYVPDKLIIKQNNEI